MYDMSYFEHTTEDELLNMNYQLSSIPSRSKSSSSSKTNSSTSLFSMTSRVSSFSTSATSMAATPISSTDKAFKLDQAELHKSLSIALQAKVVVILVGLPASGKSTVAKQLAENLNNEKIYSKIYNAGDLRRLEHKQNTFASFNACDYFNPTNKVAQKERERYAMQSLTNLLSDIKSNKISCGFLDATNSTIERRTLLVNTIKKSNVDVDNVIFLNVETSKQKYLNYNISYKAFNNDYKDKDYSFAIQDFQTRTKHYHDAYEPVTIEELESYGIITEYINLCDAGDKYSFHDFQGFSSSKTLDTLKQSIMQYKEKYGNLYIKNVSDFNSMANIEENEETNVE